MTPQRISKDVRVRIRFAKAEEILDFFDPITLRPKKIRLADDIAHDERADLMMAGVNRSNGYSYRIYGYKFI